jgi:hypothetical protein
MDGIEDIKDLDEFNELDTFDAIFMLELFIDEFKTVFRRLFALVSVEFTVLNKEDDGAGERFKFILLSNRGVS